MGVLVIVAFFGAVLIGLAGMIVGTVVPFALVGYSDGARTGLVNKISHKGLICKTYEGYVLVGNGQNVQPEQWDFTVKDESVAKQIESAEGKVATLEYHQYWITSPCWGDTSYEITGVSVSK